MNADFFSAIADIEKEKGIPQSYMIEKIEQALLAAFRRDYPQATESVRVELDPVRKTLNMYIQRTVAEEVINEGTELTLEQARAINPLAEVGDVINEPVETKKFGRIAAQAAKQVIIQGIREAERSLVYDEFTSKEHEILTGVVSRIDERSGNATLQIGTKEEYTEAVLVSTERIPGEQLSEGDRVKVYVMEVRKSARGPQILISRTHPGLVKRLFELEVPEIFEGLVEIRSLVREAGSRTKMAVSSNDPDIEPIGACVGAKGGRVAAIVEELRGEKMDIVTYSDDPRAFVAASLAPAEVLSVEILEDSKSCRAIVPESQLSLAIGKSGQNVRLAARLTGFRIDIKPETATE